MDRPLFNPGLTSRAAHDLSVRWRQIDGGTWLSCSASDSTSSLSLYSKKVNTIARRTGSCRSCLLKTRPIITTTEPYLFMSTLHIMTFLQLIAVRKTLMVLTWSRFGLCLGPCTGMGLRPFCCHMGALGMSHGICSKRLHHIVRGNKAEYPIPRRSI